MSSASDRIWNDSSYKSYIYYDYDYYKIDSVARHLGQALDRLGPARTR